MAKNWIKGAIKKPGQLHRDLKSLQVYYNPTIEELAQSLHGDVQPKPLHP